MAITLYLRKRENHDQLTIGRQLLQSQIQQDKQKPGSMADFFGQAMASANLPDYVHDKVHLEAIAYWQPDGGLPVKEDVKWLGLRKRISGLNDMVEGDFTLNPAQADLIWKRLKDERFKGSRGEQWSEFLLDYLTVTKNVFEDVGADLLDDTNLDDPRLTG